MIEEQKKQRLQDNQEMTFLIRMWEDAILEEKENDSQLTQEPSSIPVKK